MNPPIKDTNAKSLQVLKAWQTLNESVLSVTINPKAIPEGFEETTRKSQVKCQTLTMVTERYKSHCMLSLSVGKAQTHF